jgi:hypothetical protein
MTQDRQKTQGGPMNTKRRSTCAICGTRLSAQTADGEIKWKPSQVDDRGIYCRPCYESLKTARNGKPGRTLS